jgi:hypothetical protein
VEQVFLLGGDRGEPSHSRALRQKIMGSYKIISIHIIIILPIMTNNYKIYNSILVLANNNNIKLN